MRIKNVVFGILFGVTVNAYASAQSPEALSFEEVYKLYNEHASNNAFDQALPYAKRAYILGRGKYGLDSANTGALAYNLGLSALNTDELSLAETHLLESLEIFEKIYGKKDLRLLDSLMELGSVMEKQGKYKESVTYLQKASNLLDEKDENGRLIFAEIQLRIGGMMLAGADLGENRISRAISHFKKSREIYNAAYGENSSQAALATFSLGKANFTRDYQSDAEENFSEALSIWQGNDDVSPSLKISAHSYLVGLYEKKGESDRANDHCVLIGLLQGEDFVDGERPLYRVLPVYPTSARAARQEGEVLVSFTVTETGKVIDPVVVEQKGSDSFVRAAKEAVLQFRYAPAIQNGEPVATKDVKTLFTFLMAS